MINNLIGLFLLWVEEMSLGPYLQTEHGINVERLRYCIDMEELGLADHIRVRFEDLKTVDMTPGELEKALQGAKQLDAESFKLLRDEQLRISENGDGIYAVVYHPGCEQDSPSILFRINKKDAAGVEEGQVIVPIDVIVSVRGFLNGHGRDKLPRAPYCPACKEYNENRS